MIYFKQKYVLSNILLNSEKQLGGFVIKLVYLSHLYESRLKQFGVYQPSVNTTRLKKPPWCSDKNIRL